MKSAAILFCLLFGVLSVGADAQNYVQYFGCIQLNVSCAAALRSNSVPIPAATVVSVAGYFVPGDSAGGSFVVGPQCASYTTAGDTHSTNQITHVLNVTNLQVGSSISGAGIPSGAEVTSVSSGSPYTITITLAATSSNSGTSLTISGDNGGTLIQDRAPTPDCFYKTNYRGDPHEFGAVGDGVTNDTAAIQNWLGAYGSVPALSIPATSPPPNFGLLAPTIPASYLVDSPLVCPQNATIQGPTNLSGQGTPRVGFVASPTFAGIVYPYPTPQPPLAPPGYFALQGVIGAMQYCRLSGIAVTGNGFELATTGTTNGTSTVSVATLTNASGNVVQVGNAVAATDIPAGSVVTGTISSPCCSVTISQVPGSTLNETVTFYGPDAVDVLGKRVTIDGFSNLSQGRYNLFCGIPASGQELYGLQMKDSEATGSLSDNLYIPGPCPNVRLIGDIVTGSGGNGIYFGGTEGTISGGTIEESQGAGLYISQASRLSVNAMHFQGNGMGSAGGQAIVIDRSNTISICGNHMEGNGGNVANSADVLFLGASDNITACGNAHQTETVQGGTASNPTYYLAPSYIYDAGAAAQLTNSRLYETPEPPGIAVFTTAAQPLLQPLQVPQFTQNQISGLTLANGGDTHSVNVLAGAAADSTNSVLIQFPSRCHVDLSTTGPGGLDTGNFVETTTYYIYAIAAAAGAVSGATPPSPSCMASASPIAPQFSPASFPTGSGYTLAATGGTVTGSTTVYNVHPLNGVTIGSQIQTLDGTTIPSGTMVNLFTVNAGPMPLPTGNVSNASNTITGLTPGTASIQPGMAIADLGSGNCIPQNAIVETVTPATDEITISQTTTCAESGAVPLGITGASQLVIGGSGAGSTEVASIEISTAYYRMVGAVYSFPGVTPAQLVAFTQDSNTYYLDMPVADIDTATLGMGATPFPLSVPLGLVVEAFGRCVANAKVRVFSFGQSSLIGPQPFPTVPGYDTQSTITPQTSFPFRAYTNIAGEIKAQANGSGTTLYCMTDGWVLPR